jgi:hypothetical protein
VPAFLTTYTRSRQPQPLILPVVRSRIQAGKMPVMRAIGAATAVRVALLAIVALASAGQTVEPELSQDPGELRGEWLAVEVNGTQSWELGVVVTFDDGTVDTANVCNGFTVSYGFGDNFIQWLRRNTTVTYGGTGCVAGDDVDGHLLSLLYFNSDPSSVTIDGDRLRLVSGQETAELIR